MSTQMRDPLIRKPSVPINTFDAESNVLYPLWVAMGAAIGAFLFGWTLGFSGPAAQPMENSNDELTSPFVCTEWNTDDPDSENYALCKSSPQGDLFFSIVNLGCMIGAVLGGFLMDRFGRKSGKRAKKEEECEATDSLLTHTFTALFLASIPFCGVFLWQSLATVYWQLMTARILTGTAVGVVSCTVPVYIAEVAPPRLRGAMGCVNQLFITVGIFAVYAAGLAFEKSVNLEYEPEVEKGFARWTLISQVGAVVAGIYSIVTLVLLPESPKWLVTNDKLESARENLVKLRGESYDVSGEIDDQLNAAAIANSNNEKARLSDLLKPELRKQMFVGCSLMVLQQFTGINAVIFFSTDIFSDAGVEGSTGSVIVMGVQVVFTLIACLVVDKLGRKPLLYIASGGMFVSSLSMAAFYFLKDAGNEIDMLAIGSMIGYIVFFSLGMGAIPWLLMSEIFPANVRGIAGSFATGLNWTCSFIMTESFGTINNLLGPSWVFVAFAVELAVTFLFIWKFVPETKGKTLEEVEAFFV